jgi:hypothetical protein
VDLRKALGWQVSSIILTGDVRAEVLRDITRGGCACATKPTKPAELAHLVQQLLADEGLAKERSVVMATATPGAATIGTIFVVDDSSSTRDAGPAK